MPNLQQLAAGLLFVLPVICCAQKNYSPQIAGAEKLIYKTTPQGDLGMWIFRPEGWKAGDDRPAAVFFFGGGWKGGSPNQFVPHAKLLASRGMVAAVADYRVASRHKTLAKDCVEDCKSAVRYLREHAADQGIDPDRILAGGGSAGGHTAACTALIKGFEVGDTTISSIPNALVLYNPALALAPVEGKPAPEEDRSEEMRERMGVEAEVLSPIHHVQSGAPPTIIFHGKDDKTVPYVSAEWFTEAMTEAGNRCDLYGFDGEGHGFFNNRKADPEHMASQACAEKLDAFLVTLGWLETQ